MLPLSTRQGTCQAVQMQKLDSTLKMRSERFSTCRRGTGNIFKYFEDCIKNQICRVYKKQNSFVLLNSVIDDAKMEHRPSNMKMGVHRIRQNIPVTIKQKCNLDSCEDLKSRLYKKSHISFC